MNAGYVETIKDSAILQIEKEEQEGRILIIKF
jgi:hypothetical protein